MVCDVRLRASKRKLLQTNEALILTVQLTTVRRTSQCPSDIPLLHGTTSISDGGGSCSSHFLLSSSTCQRPSAPATGPTTTISCPLSSGLLTPCATTTSSLRKSLRGRHDALCPPCFQSLRWQAADQEARRCQVSGAHLQLLTCHPLPPRRRRGMLRPSPDGSAPGSARRHNCRHNRRHNRE